MLQCVVIFLRLWPVNCRSNIILIVREYFLFDDLNLVLIADLSVCQSMVFEVTRDQVSFAV